MEYKLYSYLNWDQKVTYEPKRKLKINAQANNPLRDSSGNTAPPLCAPMMFTNFRELLTY